ncbi:hypothetical protein SeMB42_g05448, partial [Synchytrium endobioticum]
LLDRPPKSGHGRPKGRGRGASAPPEGKKKTKKSKKTNRPAPSRDSLDGDLDRYMGRRHSQ